VIELSFLREQLRDRVPALMSTSNFDAAISQAIDLMFFLHGISPKANAELSLAEDVHHCFFWLSHQ